MPAASWVWAKSEEKSSFSMAEIFDCNKPPNPHLVFSLSASLSSSRLFSLLFNSSLLTFVGLKRKSFEAKSFFLFSSPLPCLLGMKYLSVDRHTLINKKRRKEPEIKTRAESRQTNKIWNRFSHPSRLPLQFHFCALLSWEIYEFHSAENIICYREIIDNVDISFTFLLPFPFRVFFFCFLFLCIQVKRNYRSRFSTQWLTLMRVSLPKKHFFSASDKHQLHETLSLRSEVGDAAPGSIKFPREANICWLVFSAFRPTFFICSSCSQMRYRHVLAQKRTNSHFFFCSGWMETQRARKMYFASHVR